MQKMPFYPLDAGYSSSVNDGVRRIALDGGGGRYRVDILGGADIVNATWRLYGDEYSMFMAFVRRWIRSGGQRFEIDLVLDSHEIETYQASFIPESISRPRSVPRMCGVRIYRHALAPPRWPAVACQTMPSPFVRMQAVQARQAMEPEKGVKQQYTLPPKVFAPLQSLWNNMV